MCAYTYVYTYRSIYIQRCIYIYIYIYIYTHPYMISLDGSRNKSFLGLTRSIQHMCPGVRALHMYTDMQNHRQLCTSSVRKHEKPCIHAYTHTHARICRSDSPGLDQSHVAEKSRLRTVIEGDTVVQLDHTGDLRLGSHASPMQPEINKDFSIHVISSSHLKILSQVERAHVRKTHDGPHFRVEADGELTEQPFLEAFEEARAPSPAEQVCVSQLLDVPFDLSCRSESQGSLPECMECLLQCLETRNVPWNETTDCLSGLLSVAEAREDGQTDLMKQVLREFVPVALEDGLPLCPRRKQNVLHVLSVAGSEHGQQALAEFLREGPVHDEEEWSACVLDVLVDLHRVKDPHPELFEEVRRLSYPDARHAHDIGTRRVRGDSIFAPSALLVLGSMGRSSASGSHPELHKAADMLLSTHLHSLLTADEKFKQERAKFEAMALHEFETTQPHAQQRFLQHTEHLHGLEFREAWEASTEDDRNMWRNQTVQWMADQVGSASLRR
jgi:hypothetical protein